MIVMRKFENESAADSVRFSSGRSDFSEDATAATSAPSGDDLGEEAMSVAEEDVERVELLCCGWAGNGFASTVGGIVGVERSCFNVSAGSTMALLRDGEGRKPSARRSGTTEVAAS